MIRLANIPIGKKLVILLTIGVSSVVCVAGSAYGP